MAGRARGLRAAGFALRVVFAVALVLATCNPARYRFADLALDHPAGATSMVALAGVLVAELVRVLTDRGVRDLSSGAAMARTRLIGPG